MRHNQLMTTAFRFSKPQVMQSLDNANLWSLTSAEEADAEFRFLICQKTETGYVIHGQGDEMTDAFNLKRELSAELGVLLFLRAKRIERASFSIDSDEAYEACKDFWNEGRATHEVPTALQPAFRHFCRSHGRSAR